MTERTSIFATPTVASPLDVSDFAPKPQPDARPRVEEIDAATANSRFQSREPAIVTPVAVQSTQRKPMGPCWRSRQRLVCSGVGWLSRPEAAHVAPVATASART